MRRSSHLELNSEEYADGIGIAHQDFLEKCFNSVLEMPSNNNWIKV